MKDFKVKWFTRFARPEGIADGALVEGIDRAKKGSWTQFSVAM